MPESHRVAVRKRRHTRQHLRDERSRSIDLAGGPQRKREKAHRGDAGVLSETERQIVVAPGLEQGQRPFEMLSRLAILPGEPASHSGGAMRDAGFG